MSSKTVVDDNLILFLFFFREIRLDILCKLYERKIYIKASSSAVMIGTLCI